VTSVFVIDRESCRWQPTSLPSSLRLQSASPAPTSSPLVGRECHQDVRPDVHLVSSGLYCNSLLYGISDGLLRRLPSVQNAAARLATDARRCNHITPVLRQLHWLPVNQRVVFTIAGLVHQSLVGSAPAYLADDCRFLSDVGRRSLRSNSNDTRKLLVPRTHNRLGDRSFSAADPRLWNDLFQPDFGGRDCSSTPIDNLLNLI